MKINPFILINIIHAEFWLLFDFPRDPEAICSPHSFVPFVHTKHLEDDRRKDDSDDSDLVPLTSDRMTSTSEIANMMNCGAA